MQYMRGRCHSPPYESSYNDTNGTTHNKSDLSCNHESSYNDTNGTAYN